MGKKKAAKGESKVKGKVLKTKLSPSKTIQKKNDKLGKTAAAEGNKDDTKLSPSKTIQKKSEKFGKTAATKGNKSKLLCDRPFILYYVESVNELKRENPSMKISKAIKSQMGKDWEALSRDQKRPYFERANEAKETNKKAKRQHSKDELQKSRKKVKKEQYLIKTRLSLKSIVEIVQYLTEDQKQAVKEIGFGGLLSLSCTHLDRELCGWLVSNFDISTCCLNVHGRNLPITTLDVHNVMGIRSEGIVKNNEGSKEDISDLCQRYNIVDGQLKVSELLEDLRTMVDGREEFRVKFALLALGCLCCPGTKPGIKASLSNFLKEPTTLATMNWGRLLLDNLLIDVRNYKEKNTGGGCVGGCVFFLMIFYFDKVVPFGATPTSDAHSSPTLGFWGNAEIKSRTRFIYQKGLLTKEKVELVEVMAPVDDAKEVEDKNEPPTTSRSTSEEDNRFKLLEKELAEVKVDLRNLSTLLTSEVITIKEEIKEISEKLPLLIRQVLSELLATQRSERERGGNVDSHIGDIPLVSEKVASTSPIRPAFPDVVVLSEGVGVVPREKPTMSENGSSPHVKGAVIPEEDSPDTAAHIQLKEWIQNDPIEVFSVQPAAFPVKNVADLSPPHSPHDQSSICQQIRIRSPSKRAPSKYCKSPYFNVEKVVPQKPLMTSVELDSLPLRKAQKIVGENIVLRVKIVPFKPFENKIVKFVFDAKLQSSEIIVRSEFEHATRGDLQCLKEGAWINDMVINCIIGKLTYQAKKKRVVGQQERWFLPTFVSQNAVDGNQDVQTMGNNFFGQNKYTGDVKAVKKIFCPINDNNAHWFCCLIDMEDRQVYILDSMISPGTHKRREDMVKKLVLFIHDILTYSYGKLYDMNIKNFPIHRCMWVPQQKNSDDCGVYVINFMYIHHLSPGVEFVFQPNESRHKILLDLVQSKYNRLREQVLADVEAYDV